MLREIPDCESGYNDDYERWLFEVMRQEWEGEQQQEGGSSDEEEARSGPPRWATTQPTNQDRR